MQWSMPNAPKAGAVPVYQFNGSECHLSWVIPSEDGSTHVAEIPWPFGDAFMVRVQLERHGFVDAESL